MKMRKFLIRNIKKARDQIDGKLIITPKSKDGDLVTNFDTKVEKFLIKKIKRTYPDFDIVSEELNGEKKITKNCFIIDPIDGTNNFARKIPVWGMQIACIKDGKAIASVVYLPIYEELYSADESGAYLNDEKIYVNKQNEKIGVYSVSPRTKNLDALQSKNPNSRNFGSAAFSFAMLACGKISAVFVLTDSKPWDVVPGEYLAKQAGAVVFNIGNNRISANSKSWGDLLKTTSKKEAEKPIQKPNNPQKPISTVLPPPPFSPVPRNPLFEAHSPVQIKNQIKQTPQSTRPVLQSTQKKPAFQPLRHTASSVMSTLPQIQSQPKPRLSTPLVQPKTSPLPHHQPPIANRPPLITTPPKVNTLKMNPTIPQRPVQTNPLSPAPQRKITSFSIEESETMIETFLAPTPKTSPEPLAKTNIAPSLSEARKKKIIM